MDGKFWLWSMGLSTIDYRLKEMISITKTAELSGHGNPIFTLELSQKPGILFTGGNDKGLVEWSLKTNAFIKVLFPVTASIYAIHCPVGYPLLFAGLRNGDVLVFDFSKQTLLPPLKHHRKPVFDIRSVAGKKELLVASEDGTVSVWSLDTLELLHTIKISHDTIRCMSISPDEKRVAFGCRNNEIKIYDLEDYTPVKTLHGHTMPVFSLQYSKNGNIPAHLFAVNCIALHPALPYFATASMDKSVKIWGLDDFKLHKTISREKGFESHSLSINKIVWSGDQLISVSDDKKIMVWDIEFED
jgi:centriolar protein POC1